MQKETIEWHKYPEEEPKHSGRYLVTVDEEYLLPDEEYLSPNVVNIDTLHYDKERKIFGYFDLVPYSYREIFVPFDDEEDQSSIAWSELPKGYKEN